MTRSGRPKELTLHVAAQPFPTPQGTQAAISQMLRALARNGRAAELLVYAYGQGRLPADMRVQRLRDWPRVRSLRSGPSLGKLALDAQLALSLRSRTRRARASLLIAHHVEAGLAARWRAPVPWVFFAHTDLEGELPSYAAPRWASPLSRLAGNAEACLSRRAAAVAVISPVLADRYARRHGVHARYVPTPWPLATPASARERLRAREALGLPVDVEVMLYAGNLDAYQGWPVCVEALVRAGTGRRRLLVATASDPRPLQDEALRAGVGERVQRMPLRDESDRRLAHAAADVALVPRRASGGLPIKLLESLSRGVPTVAMRGASAGLSLHDGAWLSGDDAEGFVAAVEDAFRAPQASRARSANGRRYIASRHSDARFLAAYDALARDALQARIAR